MQNSSVGTSDAQDYIIFSILFWLVLLCVILIAIRKRRKKNFKKSNASQAPTETPREAPQPHTNQLVPPMNVDVLSHRITDIRTEPPTNYLYAKKHYLLTRHERYFYRRLHFIFGKHYLIFPQIHLDNLFDHTRSRQDWRAALSKIQRKSVDFVLCTTDFKILLAIELDDYTHNAPGRQDRDKLVEYIFRQAGTPLVRFSNVDNLTDQEIYRKVMRASQQSNTPNH